MKTDLAIVGIWYDGYYDIWEDFLELKEMFWENCPYPMYIINQTKELSFTKDYNATVIHAGKDAEYSKKVQTALREIDANYYLLLLEDFFFSKEINGASLEKQISIMRNYNLYYYSMPLKEFCNMWKGSVFLGNRDIHNIEKSSEYTICCQPAIWERKFLEKCIGTGNYNAWVFEGIYTKSRYAHEKEFLDHCKVDVSNPLNLRHGALQGKMLPSIVDYYDGIGYEMHNKRPRLDYMTFRIDELKNKLKTYIPLKLQLFIKRFINTNSVVGRYDKEITDEIIRMGMK